MDAERKDNKIEKQLTNTKQKKERALSV